MTGTASVAQMTANPDDQMQAAPEKCPSVEMHTQIDGRLEARADVASVYASVLGVNAKREDLVAVLNAHRLNSLDGQVQGMAMVEALTVMGLVPHLTPVTDLQSDQWPALACMTSGQVVLVLGQDADQLVVYDTTCADDRAYVPKSDFAPFFSGFLVHAEHPQIPAIEQDPSPAKTNWFWSRIGHLRSELAKVALGSVATNLLAVAVVVLALQIYDGVIVPFSGAMFGVLVIGISLAMLFEAFIKILRVRLAEGAAQHFELNVLHTLMQRLMGDRSHDQGEAQIGIIKKMREFNVIRKYFTEPTIGGFSEAPFVLVFLLIAGVLVGPVVWVLIAGGVLMGASSFFWQRRIVQGVDDVDGADAHSARLVQKTFFKSTNSSNLGPTEGQVFVVWQQLKTLDAETQPRHLDTARVLSFCMQQVIFVGAIIASAFWLPAGEFAVGTLVALGIMTARIVSPIVQLARAFAQWRQVKAAIETLEAVSHAPQEPHIDPRYTRCTDLSGRFELREVSVRSAADRALLLDVPALHIEPGQKVSVIGASGAGTSTLLKALTGSQALSSGRVLIDGIETTQIDPTDLRRQIGFLGQDVAMVTGTLRDNLNLDLFEPDEERLFDALAFAGLSPFVRDHPRGLDLPISDTGGGLTNGQRQSIGWARLWLQNPKICVLDEPTSALDRHLKATLVDRLSRWLDGRTTIIATDRMPLVALTDRMLVLQQGQLVMDGPKDEVLAHFGWGGIEAPQSAIAS